MFLVESKRKVNVHPSHYSSMLLFIRVTLLFVGVSTLFVLILGSFLKFLNQKKLGFLKFLKIS